MPAPARAKKFGVAEATAYRACRSNGLNFGPAGSHGRSATSKRRRRRIAAAVKKGAGVADAAARFGVSTQTAWASCREFGVEPEQVNPRRMGSLAARRALGLEPGAVHILRLLLRTELTYAEIGEQTGISRQRVGQVFTAMRRTCGPV